MRTTRYTAKDVVELAGRGESQTLEYKLAREDQTELGELITAFANAEGGTVLIGVTDDGEVVGVAEPDAIEAKLVAAAHSSSPALDQVIDTYILDIGGKAVVVGQLEPVSDAVYSYKSVFRRRRGASNVGLSGPALSELVQQRSNRRFDSQPLAELDVEALNPDSINVMLDSYKRLGPLFMAATLTLDSYPSTSADEFLHEAGVLARVGGRSVPTVAGLLMLGSNPQHVLPHATVQCGRFRGLTVRGFHDRKLLHGSIYEQMYEVMAFIGRNTALAAYITGVERVDVPQFPIAAVREAVANALMHRDYSARGEVINVNIFNDKIEVISPGGLLPGVSLASVSAGNHPLRNEKTAALMSWLRLVESWGTGIGRMREAMQDAGLPQPVFEVSETSFKVTLFGHVAMPPTSVQPAPVEDSRDVPPRWKGLNSRQREVLAEFEQAGRGTMTTGKYVARFGVSDEQARTDLLQIVERGFMQRHGKGRATRYVLVPAGDGEERPVSDS